MTTLEQPKPADEALDSVLRSGAVSSCNDLLGVRRTHLDLFSGLAGFALAAAANDVETKIFCEQNEDCCNFLASAWGLPIVRDVRNFDGTKWRGIWLLTAGVPCQPASRAGKQLGEADDRWLWPEALRIAEESGATWLLFENPDGLSAVGLDGVLSEMERIGYEVGTVEIPACAVNSPQLRNRLWIVGHAKSLDGGLLLQSGQERPTRAESSRATENRALANGRNGKSKQRCEPAMLRRRAQESKQTWVGARARALEAWADYEWIPCEDGKRRRSKSGLCGLADGIPAGILEALGNSIVWPIAAEVIEAMIATEARTPNAKLMRSGEESKP